MIVTRTPYRISFVGGGSDMASFYTQSPGCVVSTSIASYIYITVHPTFNTKEIKIKHSEFETVTERSKIKHAIVKAALELYGIDHGIEISSTGDFPAQTGLGSSSSFTVGLLTALARYTQTTKNREQIAAQACHIEIEILKEPIGKQDQYAAAMGGFNQIQFLGNGEVVVNPIHLSNDALTKLQSRLVMFYTGVTRSAKTVLSQQQKNVSSDVSKQDILKQMVAMCTPLREDLEADKIDSFGEYLHQNWLLKRKLATAISNDGFDEMYDLARENGALGGKILGAGGGGFFLFYCPEDKIATVANALQIPALPVRFDTTGTQVVYTD